MTIRILVLIACLTSLSAASTDAFLAAFHAGDYRTALTASERLPGDDPLASAYRASCLSMLGRSEDAVETFRAGARQVGVAADQVMIFSRAQALHDARLHARAQLELDAMERRFPHSRLSERGKELRQRIERRLAAGLTAANCDWYLDRGLAAYENARPALAAEYLDEWRLLAGRAGIELAPRGLLTLGAITIELDECEAALAHLSSVPPATEDWRGALFLGLALSLHGEQERARSLLAEARDRTGDARVRTRATDLLSRPVSAGNTP